MVAVRQSSTFPSPFRYIYCWYYGFLPFNIFPSPCFINSSTGVVSVFNTRQLVIIIFLPREFIVSAFLAGSKWSLWNGGGGIVALCGTVIDGNTKTTVWQAAWSSYWVKTMNTIKSLLSNLTLYMSDVCVRDFIYTCVCWWKCVYVNICICVCTCKRWCMHKRVYV